jgi:hypothetical protein
MTYLYPRSLYAAEAAQIMCAPADLPMPCEMKPGIRDTFKMFPVRMNVLAAEAGSCANPDTACCAAANALVILIAVSLWNSVNDRAKGSSGGLRDEALTAGSSVSFHKHHVGFTPQLTIVKDYTWNAKDFPDRLERIDDISRLCEVALDIQLFFRTLCLIDRSGSEGYFVAF